MMENVNFTTPTQHEHNTLSHIMVDQSNPFQVFYYPRAPPHIDISYKGFDCCKWC
jgi:hypothetical protein